MLSLPFVWRSSPYAKSTVRVLRVCQCGELMEREKAGMQLVLYSWPSVLLHVHAAHLLKLPSSSIRLLGSLAAAIGRCRTPATDGFGMCQSSPAVLRARSGSPCLGSAGWIFCQDLNLLAVLGMKPNVCSGSGL
jgi:hypothetical protein